MHPDFVYAEYLSFDSHRVILHLFPYFYLVDLSSTSSRDWSLFHSVVPGPSRCGGNRTLSYCEFLPDYSEIMYDSYRLTLSLLTTRSGSDALIEGSLTKYME